MAITKAEVDKVLEVARGALKSHAPVIQALEKELRKREVPCDQHQISSGTTESLHFIGQQAFYLAHWLTSSSAHVCCL
jgi:hypothetical protein